ncbi:MAG TPA: hypothetical protein VH643_21265 [Gemmataceae bacterium]|jgi:hypothetical protein
MNYRHDAEADGVAQARNLLAVAAQELDRLEIVASQAFCQLTALAGILTRLEKLGVSPEPESVEAAALDVAMVCREAEGLIRYLTSHEWDPTRVTSPTSRRGWPLAPVCSPSR